jgi:hypothetical protein
MVRTIFKALGCFVYTRTVQSRVFLKSQESCLIVRSGSSLALQRSKSSSLWTHYVIEIEPSVYRLLSSHQLIMLADSQIHQATCILLVKKWTNKLKLLSRNRGAWSLNSSLEKKYNFRDISVNGHLRIKSPVYWNQIFNFLFCILQIYGNKFYQITKISPQDEINRDLMFGNFPKP